MKKKRKSPDVGRSLAIVRQYFPHVTGVVDASTSIEIEVLPRDIKGSGVKSTKNCALARACRRAYRIDGALIAQTRAYLIQGDTATRYCVPQSVTREITAFDRGATFEPGVYALTAMSASNRFGAHRKYEGVRPNEYKNRVARHVTTNVRTPFSK